MMNELGASYITLHEAMKNNTLRGTENVGSYRQVGKENPNNGQQSTEDQAAKRGAVDSGDVGAVGID